MHVECHLVPGIHEVFFRHHTHHEVLVVEVLSGIHFKHFLRDFSWLEVNGAPRAGERHAIDKEFGSVRVVGLAHVERIV